jgi:hypothetical protein
VVVHGAQKLQGMALSIMNIQCAPVDILLNAMQLRRTSRIDVWIDLFILLYG